MMASFKLIACKNFYVENSSFTHNKNSFNAYFFHAHKLFFKQQNEIFKEVNKK